MKSVLYNVKTKKIINGTLFYAMEYFLVLNEIEPTQLILKCDKKIYDFILECFDIKYDYDKNLNKLIKYASYTEIHKLTDDKVLILDNYTFHSCKNLTKNTVYHYSDKGENEITDTSYGFYDYQTFKHKVRLKLALSYHKRYKETQENFTSSLNVVKGENSKKPNKFKNLMEVKNWHYEHNGFDSGNRFIIEARYFNKNLTHSDIKFDDSVYDRLHSDIGNFILTKDDKLIKDFSA
jgi:hypothetical protein